MLKQVGARCGRWGLDEVLPFLWSSPWPVGWPIERHPLASVSLAWASNTVLQMDHLMLHRQGAGRRSGCLVRCSSCPS